MRCLTLADVLRGRGAETMFVSAALPPALEARLVDSGHGVEKIAWPDGLDRNRVDWHEPPLGRGIQEQDAAATLQALGQPANWIVVDHYLLDWRWHSAARRSAERVLVIDDLANRRLDCDLLLDETLSRRMSDYESLVRDDAIILTGVFYALLRPEFARARPAALQRRRGMPTTRRILVSLGMTDVDGVTASVVESLLRQKREWAIDVVLGERTESLAAMQTLAAAEGRITLHVNSNRMAELMANADFAIGAGGTSAWERCCLGLPSATLVLADNQALVTKALAEAGAAITLYAASDAGDAVARVVDDPRQWANMSEASFTVTDGGGASRIADHILAPETRRQTTSVSE